MFLRYFVLLSFLITLPLKAKTLHVEYGFNIFSISISEKEITYQKKSYKDSVIKKKCSEKLFSRFYTKIESLTKNFPKDQKESADFMVKFRYEEKTGQLNPTHKFAKKILSIPQDFDSFRLATEFRCEGEKEE